MTAISAVEIACWDLIGKACDQPVYRLLGGRCHERIPAYANGWYGGACSPAEFAQMAAGRRGEGLSGTQVRPVRDGLEGARSGGRRCGGRDRRGGARGRRGRRRLDDRVSRPARRGTGVRHDPPARTVPSGLVRRAGRAGVSRPAGRGEAVGRLSDRRRRAALHPGRLLSADRAPRRRRGPDGPRSLRRHPGRQEDRGHGRCARPARRASLLDRAGRAGRLPALRCQHARTS